MNGDLISIIVPVYNVGRYLEQCINSIICQTYPYLEIILVNDGSTDHSEKIIESFRQKDSRIRYIVQSNQGLSSARNLGKSVAKGSYIAFVDADDYIADDYVESLYHLLCQGDAELAVCGYYEITEAGEITGGSNVPAHTVLLDEESFWKLCHEDKGVYCTVAWNKMYKKSIFESIEYPVGKIHEDEFVLHEIVSAATVIAAMEERKYYYRRRAGSILEQEDILQRFDLIEAFSIRLEYFLERKQYIFAEFMFEKILYYLYDMLDGQKDRQFYRKLDEAIAKIKGTILHMWRGRIPFKLRQKLFIFWLTGIRYYRVRAIWRSRRRHWKSSCRSIGVK